MIHQIFTVYDSKAEAYLAPFFSNAKGAALRSFVDTVLDKSHPFNKHPEDYTLFYLGEFDDLKANFDLQAAPISLGCAIEFMNSEETSDAG